MQKDQRGRIHVDQYLRVKDRPGVWPSAIARAYSTMDHRFQPRPGRRTGGQGAAANLVAEIKNQEPVAFRYRSVGQLVDLGEGRPRRHPGSQARWADRGVYLEGVYLYELGYDLNRAHVLADWTIDLFSRPDTSKLFEGSERPDTDT